LEHVTTTRSPDEPDPLPAGYHIANRYVIELELPPAGMGRVYRAWDPIVCRRVAVNVLAPHLRDPKGVARFVHYFRVAAERDQQAVASGSEPRVLDLFSIGGTVGVVVAYAEGSGALDIAQS